jgi:regulator of replication initiation timing
MPINMQIEYPQLENENQALRLENEILKIRVKYLENLITEYSDMMKVSLSGTKVNQFLKDQINQP